MNVYIIGFMATGKSMVGQELARRLGRGFVDLDSYLENKSGKSIQDIFAREGEVSFRAQESAALAEVSKGDGIIIACGGGIVTREENIRLMKQTGRILCLTASVDEILRRCAGSGQRPLLNAGDRRAVVEKLVAERSALYTGAADMTVDTTGLSVGQVADAACRLLDAKA